MSIRLGDRGPHVRRWRELMNVWFSGYGRIHGPLPIDTDEYGSRAAAWQREYEARTGQIQDGVVSDQDLAALGISAPKTPQTFEKPWLFTVHGTGQPDPSGPGLPADTARACLGKYRWQPIGNYSAAVFPMWPSVEQGVAELSLQIEDKLSRDNSTFALAGYSQGAIVVGQVLKHQMMRPGGRLHKYLPRLRKVALWGNPMRQQGIAAFDEWIHPIAKADAHGILEDRLEGLEHATFEIRDYAHDGDMYAAARDSDKDEYKVAVAKIVMTAKDFYTGPDSVVSQLRELSERPLIEGVAAATAAIDALRFFTNTAHGYNINPAIHFLNQP